MRVSGTTLQRIMLGAALLLALCWNFAYAKEIKGLALDTGATGTRAEVLLDVPADYQLLSLSGPDRLVLDLPGVDLPSNLPVPAGAGIVRAVRTGHPVPGTTRIVFDLAAPVVALKPRLEPSVGGSRLVLEWPGDGEPAPSRTAEAATAAAILAGASLPVSAPATSTPEPVPQDPAAASAAATSRLIAHLPSVRPEPGTPAATPAAISAPQASTQVARPVATTIATGVPTRAATGVPAAAPPPTRSLQDMRGGMRPLLIAIDAGHGGQDPGAIGKAGRREKDVTLAISRELARQVNATPGLKAYLVRDADVFVPLEKRARLAGKAGADMFISIHADAAENRSADGSSVYVLSLRGASSQRARWLASKENAADLIGGVRMQQASSTLTSVLLDLTQSGNMKASEDAAGQVLSGLQRVGNIHKREIERANFAVLRTSDMPAMLVETAFISNPDEERRLGDPAFQRKLAGAVLDGINTYFTRQPPPGTLFAARAAATVGGAAGSH